MWLAAGALLALAAVMLLPQWSASAAVQFVDDDYVADNPLLNQWTTIQKGINAATGGDQVYIYAGSYKENVVVNKSVDIVGQSGTGTVVVASGGNGFNVIVSNVYISTLTITGANYGIQVSGFFINSVTIDQVTVEASIRGVYTQSVIGVTVSNSYFGNNSGSSGAGIFSSLGSGLVAHNNTFYNDFYGVFLDRTNGAVVRDSQFEQNRYGTYLSNTKSSYIWRNYIANRSVAGYGVFLTNDHDSVIEQNNVTNISTYGIYFSSSFNETLKGNWMTNNTVNWFMSPYTTTTPAYFGHTITSSNLIEGRPMYYYVNTSGVSVPSGGGWVGAVNVSNIYIPAQVATNVSIGVMLINVQGAQVVGLNFSSNYTGSQYAVSVHSSNAVTLDGVNVTGYALGLYAWYTTGLTMKNSRITGAPGGFLFYTTAGYLYYCDGASVFNNTLQHAQGFRFYYGESALAEANTLNDTDLGFYLYGASYSRLYSNTLTNSTGPLTVGGYLDHHYQVTVAANNSWEGRPVRSFLNASSPFVPLNIAWALFYNVTNANVTRYYTAGGTSQAAVVAYSDSVTFLDARFNQTNWGFYIFNSANTRVLQSQSDGSDTVFYLENAPGTQLTNGTWTNIAYEGAYIYGSPGVLIENTSMITGYADYIAEVYSSPSLTVRNVTASRVYAAFYVEVSDFLTIERLSATGLLALAGWTGIYLYNVSFAYIANSSISEFPHGVYLSWNNWHIAVYNVTFSGTANFAFYSPSGGGADLSLVNSRFQGSRGPSQYAVYIEDVVAGAVLAGLNISNFDEGVFIDPSSGVVVSGNQINNTTVGIHLVSVTNSLVTQNTITDTGTAGILAEFCSGVTISLNNITNGGSAAIALDQSTSMSVLGNAIEQPVDGIRFSGGGGSTVAGNTVNGSVSRGVVASNGVQATTFSGNVITNGYDGFYILQTSYLTLHSNAMSGNTYNFHLEANTLEQFYHTIPTNNTVDGEAIHYIVNGSSGTVPGSAGAVFLVNSTSYLVSGPSIQNEWEGIRLFQSTGITVLSASVSQSWYGMRATSTTNVTVQDSTFDGGNYGLYIEYGTNFQVLRNTFNGSAWEGLYVFYGWNITLNQNLVNASPSYGAILYYTDSSNITNNRFTNNSWVALYLYGSANNVLYNNSFSNNYGSLQIGGYGISHFSHVLPTNNTINGRPIRLYLNTTGVTVPTNTSMAILANVTGATVSGLLIEEAGDGVASYGSRFINISDTTFAGGVNGVHLMNTRDAWMWNLSTNTTACCVSTLVSLDGQVYNITLKDSVLPWAATIVQAYDTFNLLIRNLTLGDPANGTSTGSVLSASGRNDNITVEDNRFLLTYYTVYLYGYGTNFKPTNVTVANSTFGAYTYYPLYMGSQFASGVLFYHNNFNITGPQVYYRPYDPYNVTRFNLSYPYGGNWWSPVTSPDLYKGASQSVAGPDGVVDNGLNVVDNLWDFYPLVDPWPPTVRLIAPPNGSAIQPGTILDFNVSRFFDTVSVQVDGAPSVPFLPPFDINTTGWSDGDHTVWVNASDVTGVSASKMFLFTVDTTAPSISALSPSPGGIYDVGTLLNFTITDAHLAPNATWDAGWGQQPFLSQWNISTAGWADGPVNVTVRAWDTAGNMDSATFAYTIDAAPPQISLNSPANNSVFQSGTIIDLTITDTSFQNASWNNGSGWNAFSAPFDINTTGWSEGTYMLWVSAQDTYGRVSSGWGSFTIDDTVPSVTLNSPADGSYIKPGTTIDFSISDPYFQNASFSTGGAWAALTSPFDISTAGWGDGPVTVTVSAQDTAGNKVYTSRSFTVDSVRPAITLDSPANNSVVQAGATLAFTVTDTNPFTALWDNGGAQQALSSPYDISTAGWSDGAYTVTIVATDGAGNTRTSWFGFTIDSTPPTVTLNTPANNSVIKAGTVLDLSVSDAHLTGASWNNGSGAVSFSSPFDIATGGWADGATTVVVQATDSAGNVRTVSFQFTFDSTPPSVTLNTPSNGSAVKSGTTLDFAVSDANLASALWNNGGPNSTLSAPYDISTSGWSEGSYSVLVRAVDQAGNQRTVIVLVDIDDTAPSISLNQPTNGSTFGAGTLIDFGVTDAHAVTATWDNGTGANALASPFDVDTTGWTDGSYTVWVNATDAAGNAVSRFFVFTIDNSFPAVILQGPANNSVILPGTTLDFDVVDNDLNSVTWDNGSGTLTLTAPYNISTAGWADGHVNVTIVAVDNSSHTVTVVFHFILDSVAPTLSLASPSNNSVIKAGTPLNLTVSDLNIGTVTWNNGSGAVALPAPYNVPTAGWPDGSTSVTVTASDLAGNFVVRVYSFTFDSTAPAISLTSPANNSVIVAGTTVVLGISDVHSFTATWDNGSGPTSFTVQYDVPTTGWADGTVDVTVVAVDIAGNTGARTFRFTVDSLPPSVSLVGPSNGSVVQPGTTLDFAVSDAHLAVVTWDNGSGALALSSPFDVSTAGWPDGAVTVWVNATDSAGNAASRWYTFTIDGTPPTVSLNSPANASFVAPGTTIDLAVGDSNGFTVTWNNGSGPVAVSSPFDISTAGWPEGTTDLTVTATDVAGNARVRVFRFTFDGTPPGITLTSPANGSAVSAGTVIDLSITDANGVATAQWDNGGSPAALVSPYNISTAGWSDGPYNVTVTATDAAGNLRYALFVFVLDSTGPAITLNAPANGSVIRPGTTIDLSVSDAQGLSSSSWNNGSGPVAFSSPFDINTTGWPDGSTTVTVTAMDGVGNMRTASFTFTFDGTPPTVTLDSPSNGSVVLPGTTLAFSVADAHLSSVTADNGSGAAPLPSPYDISTAGWADGAYTITLAASDSAGNSRVVSFNFVVDGAPPTITLAAPANNSIIKAGTVLDLNITDANLASAGWNNGSGANALASPFDISTAGWADGSVTVTVNATDLAGNTVVRTFTFLMDSTAPNLVLNAPANNSYVSGGADLDFDASDLNLAAVTWDNGSGANALTTPFDVDTTGWPDGATNVTVVATDAAGNSVTRVFFFVIDSTPPTVVLNAPTNGSVITAGTLINLSVADVYLSTVTWNNGSGNNALSAPFDISTAGWADGSYNVTITATDLAGNARVFVARFFFDTTPPVISLASPANNSFIAPGQLLDLQITDLTSLSVSYDIGGGPIAVGVPYDVNTTGWSDGSVNMTVVAVDAVGNTASRLFHFTVDGTLPSITLISPSNNSVVVPGTSINLLITDANLNTVSWDNGGGPSAFVTQWNISTTGWSDGSYNITVDATDLAGNTRTRLVHITIDSVAPTISLGSPTNNSYIQAGTVINLSIFDLNLYQVTYDDGSGSQAFTTPWNISTAGWTDGPRNVTVTATDLAGNSLTRIYRFTRDSVLPTVSLVTPGNNSYIQAGAVVNLSISDAYLDTATWDIGGGAQSFPVPWNISTTGWSDGTYDITVTATDLAGNARVRVYRFTVDSTAPAVTLVAPAANSFIRAGTLLNFSVADATLSAVTWSNGGGNLSLTSPWQVSTTGWSDGLYTVWVNATDLAGNARQSSFQFTIDSTVPTIALVPPPANNSYIPAGTTLSLNVVETNVGTATWDRGFGAQAFGPPWTISTALWQDGAYDVVVSVTDLAGNAASRSFHFTIDSTPPAIDNPSWNGTVVATGLVLNATVTDANLAWFAWNNGALGSGNGTASLLPVSTFGWADGAYTVTLTAQDLAGNRVTRTASVTVDSVNPVISGVVPPDGSFFQPGLAIQFNASDANLLSVEWQRGAGSVLPANGTGPYSIDTAGWGDGNWTVRLIATDRAGHQAVVPLQLVTDQTPPSVPVMPTLNVQEDIQQTLDASGASDGANPLDDSSFEWNLSGRLNAILTGRAVTYAWPDPGQYSVVLTVTDRAGNSASRTFQVNVADTTPPTANAGSDQTVDQGTTVTLNGTGSSDNDALFAFQWSQTAGPAVGFNPNLAVTDFTPTVPGTYVFQLTVTDNSSLQGRDNVTVTVLDTQPPAISWTTLGVVNRGANVVFDASATTDNDPAAVGNLTFLWTFDYGEPQFLTGATPNFTFLQPGSYRVTLNVTDPSGNTATQAATLRVNDVPSLASLPPGTFTLPGTYQGILSIVDTDAGDTHNVTVHSPAAMVVTQVAGNLALEWQPEDIGFYVVDITISDGWSTANYSFNITIGRSGSGNTPPRFTSLPPQEAREGSQYTYLPTAVDDDGDSLLFGLDSGPAGMSIAPSTGRLTWSHGYTASSGYRLDDVSMWVWDGAVYTFQNFTIRFIPGGNVPPVFLDGVPGSLEVNVDNNVELPLFSYLSDANDPVGNLTVTATSGTTTVATATVTGTGQGMKLVVSGVSEGSAFVTLTVRDPSGSTATKSIQVTVRPAGTPGTGGGGDNFLLPLIGLAAAAGVGGVLFIVMRRRKGQEEPQVVQATVPAAAERVQVTEEAAVAATAAAAAVAAAPAEKAATYVIEGLFVIYKDGRLLYSKTDMGSQKFEDPELVSSMFTAVQSFIKDSFAAEGELNRMGYGENQIVIERGKHIFIAAIVYGEPDQEFTDKVRDTIEGIELSYAGVVEEWDGMMDAFSDMEGKIAPIVALTQGVSRREVQLATTKQEVRMLSELEFFQGFVRLKVGIKNNTPMVITKVTVDIEYNEDVLRLGRVEPAAYRTAGAKVLLGVLNPGEKSSVAYYFDPQICTESQIDGVCRYRDASGVLHTVSMKTRKAEVVCPLFFTKEHANTAMLKRLVESELTEKDAKVFQIQKMPAYIKWKDVFDLVKSVVNAHDVQMVREFTRFNPFQGEAWFYGETKVKNYKIVIRAAVIEEGNTIEFFAASTNMKAITGLLAEFNHTLNSTVIEKYSDLKIALLFDNETKAEVDRKSLMSQMSSEELEGGETEQDESGAPGPLDDTDPFDDKPDPDDGPA